MKTDAFPSETKARELFSRGQMGTANLVFEKADAYTTNVYYEYDDRSTPPSDVVPPG